MRTEKYLKTIKKEDLSKRRKDIYYSTKEYYLWTFNFLVYNILQQTATFGNHDGFIENYVKSVVTMNIVILCCKFFAVKI